MKGTETIRCPKCEEARREKSQAVVRAIHRFSRGWPGRTSVAVMRGYGTLAVFARGRTADDLVEWLEAQSCPGKPGEPLLNVGAQDATPALVALDAELSPIELIEARAHRCFDDLVAAEERGVDTPGGRGPDGLLGGLSDQPATSTFLARRAREFRGYTMTTRHEEAER